MVNKQVDNDFAHTLAADIHSRDTAHSQLTDLQTRYHVNLTQNEMNNIISRASSPTQNDQQTRAKVADLFVSALRQKGDPASLTLANQLAGQRIDAQSPVQNNASTQTQTTTITCNMGNRTFQLTVGSSPEIDNAVRIANDPASTAQAAENARNAVWIFADAQDKITSIRETTPGNQGSITQDRFDNLMMSYGESGFRTRFSSVERRDNNSGSA